MKNSLKLLRKTYRKVLLSIAFYPILISILCVLLAVLTLAMENWEPVTSLKKSFPYIFIEDEDTGRAMLNVFIGGIISLTVFSFSMVMVVLNQASSNFSPRLLPGLISNSKHQIILGIYVGTLLYCIGILTSMGAGGFEAKTLGLSTMVSALLSVSCIGLFIYFIHTISSAIQIQNIVDDIFIKCDNYANKRLKKLADSKVALEFIDTSDWNVLHSDTSGYYRNFDPELLQDSITAQNNQIEIVPYMNQHLWAGMPILRYKKNMTQDELQNLLFSLELSPDRHEDDRGVGGMIKLMEIAVKAMSPGINDPGTAIDAIAKLGRLLRKFFQFPDYTSQIVKNGNCVFIRNTIPASELMRIVVQPIRFYSKEDDSILFQLIGALKFIREGDAISEENKGVVTAELANLKEVIETNIKNTSDKSLLLKKLEGPFGQL